MFSEKFISRPVLSIVCSIMIVIGGVMAAIYAPIDQYPLIIPPVLNINATFPGASSEAIANAVTAPIEDQIAGTEDMIYMQSASQNGSNSVSINVYFNVGTELGVVEADTLNRSLTASNSFIPDQARAQGIRIRKMIPDLFQVIPFYSETGSPDPLYIANYVQRFIYPVIEQLHGIGFVNILGQRAYAVRINVDPKKLAFYKISIPEIIAKVRDQSSQYAIGQNAMPPTYGPEKSNFMITTTGYYTDVKQFEDVVIRANMDGKDVVDLKNQEKTQPNDLTLNGQSQIVRLKDVAEVIMDANSYNNYFFVHKRNHETGKVDKFEAVSLQLYLVPGANQLKAKAEVAEAMAKIEAFLPKGMKYFYHYDSSIFVYQAIEGVVETLLIAFLLVFCVVFLFIQDLRGTIIPILAIPVAVIGAFAGIYASGFNINTLSLFGLVLAIGIVVDDAIVVLENVERIMTEDRLNSFDATVKAMREVQAPVIAIVMVLNAVFVPVAFLGGFQAIMMQQFAVTIAISVIISGFVALTLTPALCVIFLRNVKHEEGKEKVLFFRVFDQAFAKLQGAYMATVTWIIDHSKACLTFWSVIFLLTIGMFLKIPTSVMPLEDMGYFYNVTHVNPGGALRYSVEESNKIAEKMMERIPYLDRLVVLGSQDIIDNGTYKTNTSTIMGCLAGEDERDMAHETVDTAIDETRKINDENKNITAYAFNQPPVRGLSPGGGATFYLQATQPLTVQDLHDDSVKITQHLEKNFKAVKKATQFYEVDTPELRVDVDPVKAYYYKVGFEDAYNSLQGVFGLYYINFFTKWADIFWVEITGQYDYRKNPELLNTVFIKNSDGEMVPAGNIMTVTETTGAEVVTRLNDFLASQIVVDPNEADGHTTGEIMDIVESEVPKVLGNRYAVKWFGLCYQQLIAGNQSAVALSLGLIMVFLILAALFEMWTLPIVVVMGMPFSLFGAAAVLLMYKMPNDTYFQVSLLTLIGLSAKNAILIVEFAIDAVKKEGMNYRDAALHAAKLRFRPIVMTSIAFILGAVPLVTCNGAGAHAQHSVGAGIIGGMLGSTCVAVMFIPMFFAVMMRLSHGNDGPTGPAPGHEGDGHGAPDHGDEAHAH